LVCVFHLFLFIYFHFPLLLFRVILLKGWSIAATTPQVKIFDDTFGTLSGRVENGKTAIKFTRTLLTPDENDLPITNNDVYISWAEGRDQINFETLSFSKHIISGIGVVNFYSGVAQKTISKQHLHQSRTVWTIKNTQVT
jgi:hypothetical protein